MKKIAALIILLSNLVFSFSAGVIDTNLCLVSEEYCTGDRPGDLRCDVPLGWSCGNDHNLESGIQTMVETVTITATLPTLCDRNGSRKELESGELIGQPTTTKETNFEEISINPKRTSKNSHAATTNSSRVSAQIGAEDWEWMVSRKTHSLSSMESATPARSSYTTNIHDTSTKSIDKKPPSCPEIKPILEVSCVDRARLLWNDFKITWGPAWNDRSGCRRLHKEMDKRGLVTGFHCSQLADLESNTWIMEARGHRPRFPKTLVADAIRATFSADNTIYYRGYETTMLCEKARIGANLWK